MARHMDYCYEQGKMIPIAFRDQILPGTFEYTVSPLIDHELDLSLFDQRYNNNDSGRPAYGDTCKPEIFTPGDETQDRLTHGRGRLRRRDGAAGAGAYPAGPV